MINGTEDVKALLSRRINLPEVRDIASWAEACIDNCEFLWTQMCSGVGNRNDVNALWCMTHLKGEGIAWLQSRQNELIDILLNEQHTGRKRMLLQLLREQTYTPDTIRTDFLDYCFSKINSQCEPYAIRCFSLYCSFKMSRFYPELIEELNRYLELLSCQLLSPGLKSAMRTIRKKIRALKQAVPSLSLKPAD